MRFRAEHTPSYASPPRAGHIRPPPAGTYAAVVRVLPTAANGYIGMRLPPPLLEAGHEVHCLARSRERAARAFRDYLGTTAAR